jgi:membrane-bound ClpP family serine protease
VPNWSEILNEIKEAGSTQDVVRRNYLARLSKYTKRNVIIYYSGWLQKSNSPDARVNISINDNDKNGLMSVVHKLDRSKGLDLVLHTPGGDMAATESIITYLRSMFNTDIRAIVPQMAMSGGTMIACACKEIVMGEQSCIGPFDPQVGGVPAQAIKEEFDRASKEMSADNSKAFLWQPILQKYGAGLISQCEKAIKLADEVVTQSLETGMFKDDPDKAAKVKKVIDELGSHAVTKMHARHIHKAKAIDIGLKVVSLEEDNELQDRVLSVHHSCMLTFEQTGAIKLIENQTGTCYALTAPTFILAQ